MLNIPGIICGIIIGYIASKLQKGESSGCLVNLFIGILGAWVGGFIYALLGTTILAGILPDAGAISWLGNMILSVFGAIIVLWVFSLFRK